MGDRSTTDSLVDDMADKYRADARVRLGKISDAIRQLDGGRAMNDEALSQIKQVAHSIKGTSSTFGFSGLSVVAHALDDFVNNGPQADETAFVHGLHQLNELMLTVMGTNDIVEADTAMEMLAVLDIQTGHDIRHEASPRPGEEPCAIIILPNREERAVIDRALNILGLVTIEARDGVQAIDHANFHDPAVLITTLHDDQYNAVDVVQGFSEVSITASVPIVVIVPCLDTMPDSNEREAMRLLMNTLPPHVHRITGDDGLEDSLSEKLVELEVVPPGR